MATRRAGETEVHAINEFRGRIPSLPPVKSVNAELYMGPTEESNWVIYGHLLVGAYPSSTNDLANAQLLTSILRLGVTTFVCLQQEYQHEGVTESQWRSGEKLRPYIFDAIRLVDALPDSFFTTTTVRGLIPRGKPDGLEFVHFPIVDCSIANDASVLQLCHDLSQRLLKGEVMYLHCWGGHGRTGTVVSIMLGLLYGLSPLDAMRWVQFCHDLRVAPMGTASPQTETQRQQVIRVLNAVRQAQIVHSGVSSGAGATGYSTSSHSNNNNNGELSRHSPRTLLSPQPAVSGARSGSLSMALPQNKQHALIPADATSSAVLSTGPNTDNSNGSSSSSSSSSGNNNNTFQKNSDQPQRASAAALAAASMPRTAQTAQPKPRSGSVPLRIQSQVNNVSSARAPVASWQSGTKINNGNTNANNQASTRIRRLSSAQQGQGQGSSTSSSSPSQPSHPSPQASVGYATSPGKNNTAAHGSNHGPRVSSASSSSSSSVAAPATAMSHLSPRPDAVAASALGNGAAGSPTSVREAILTDPRATAVAPLASSTATVLGLGPLLAANRSSLVFSSSSSSTTTTSSSSSINSSGQQSRGGGGASSLSTNRENPTLRPGVQQSTTEGKTSDDNGNNNGVIEGVGGGGGGGVDLPLQQQLRPSSADAAIFSRRGNNNNNSSNISGAISGNSNPVIAQSNVINYDSSSNISSSGVDRDKFSVSNSQQTNDSTVNPLSTNSDSTTNDKVPASATSPQAQFKAGPTTSRPAPGGTAQSSTASSSSQQQQGSTTTAASTSTMMTSSPRSIGGYSTRASGYAAALAQQQANTGSPTRGGGGGGGGYNQQGGGATISSPPPQRSSAAAAGLASAIAAYSTSLTGGAATSPGQGASQGGRSRLAVARQQSREPHTISSTVSGVNNYGSSTTTTESINGLANVVSPLSASTSTTAARNALFRSPAPPLEAVTSSSSSSLPSNMSPSSYRPNTSSPSSSSSGAGLAAAASINAAAALSAQNSAGRPRVRIVVRGGEPST